MSETSNRRKKNRCSKQQVSNRILDVDMFGHEVGFNLAGQSSIKSIPGLIVSVLLISVMCLYGYVRFVYLV